MAHPYARYRSVESCLLQRTPGWRVAGITARSHCGNQHFGRTHLRERERVHCSANPGSGKGWIDRIEPNFSHTRLRIEQKRYKCHDLMALLAYVQRPTSIARDERKQMRFLTLVFAPLRYVVDFVAKDRAEGSKYRSERGLADRLQPHRVFGSCAPETEFIGWM
jgi:hypothetical protein